jgi:hypothetical protein
MTEAARKHTNINAQRCRITIDGTTFAGVPEALDIVNDVPESHYATFTIRLRLDRPVLEYVTKEGAD